MDLRQFLAYYQKHFPEEIIRIEKEVDANLEATAVAAQFDKLGKHPILVFDNLRTVKGKKSEFALVLNIFADRSRIARLLYSTFENIGLDYFKKTKLERKKPKIVERNDAPVKQVIEKGSEINLFKFPALRQELWDPGPYITAGYFTCYEPETKIDNSALHRGWISRKDEVRFYLNPHSHNSMIFSKYEEKGLDMKAAFWIGHHPTVCLGSQARGSFPESHFEAAGGLAGEPVRLVPSETLGDDFMVPADAEVVIEGVVPAGKRKPEGPFGEYTGYYGPQRWGPYLEVTAVTHRRDAYWHHILAAGRFENRVLGGVAMEGIVSEVLKRTVPTVTNVYSPPSGRRVNIYVRMRKTREGQSKDALMATLSASDHIKYAFVFDDDVNIFDDEEVLWFFATRTKMDEDVVIVNECRGNLLDTMSVGGTVTKAGFDCTKPVSKPFQEVVRLPENLNVHLEDYLSDKYLRRISGESGR